MPTIASSNHFDAVEPSTRFDATFALFDMMPPGLAALRPVISAPVGSNSLICAAAGARGR